MDNTACTTSHRLLHNYTNRMHHYCSFVSYIPAADLVEALCVRLCFPDTVLACRVRDGRLAPLGAASIGTD